MSKKVRILVVCGSGMCTSTIAEEEVKKICKAEGIDFHITKSNMREIPLRIEENDIVLVTNNYKGKLEKPCLGISGLISGVNEDKLRIELVKMLHQIADEN